MYLFIKHISVLVGVVQLCLAKLLQQCPCLLKALSCWLCFAAQRPAVDSVICCGIANVQMAAWQKSTLQGAVKDVRRTFVRK